MRLDNRPKTISLSGVDFTDSDKEESLKGYLLVSFHPSQLSLFPCPSLYHSIHLVLSPPKKKRKNVYLIASP